MRTVGRAAAAGRPKAQSAVGLSGMGGLQGVAPVKGGSGLYRHGQLLAFGDGGGGAATVA